MTSTTTTAAPTAKSTPSPTPTMTAADRCDRCGARAYVAAEINGTDLLFCAHHFGRWEPGVRAAASAIRDERYRLAEEEAARKEFRKQ